MHWKSIPFFHVLMYFLFFCLCHFLKEHIYWKIYIWRKKKKQQQYYAGSCATPSSEPNLISIVLSFQQQMEKPTFTLHLLRQSQDLRQSAGVTKQNVSRREHLAKVAALQNLLQYTDKWKVRCANQVHWICNLCLVVYFCTERIRPLDIGWYFSFLSVRCTEDLTVPVFRFVH